MEIQPGWTNGIVTLRDPVEMGWYLNVQDIGSKAVLACKEDGEAVAEHPEIKGLDNHVLEKIRWPDLRFR